jgi:hypothetical protein
MIAAPSTALSSAKAGCAATVRAVVSASRSRVVLIGILYVFGPKKRESGEF